MKKELNNLLVQNDGFLKINSLFHLHRWVLNPDSDFLGREGDFLQIEFIETRIPVMPIKIISRDTAGIMNEVSIAMDKMLDSYKEDLINRWNGGILR